MGYLMGIDVGTSGTKTILCHTDGRVVAGATESYPLHAPRSGWAEQNADDWWQAAIKGIRKVLRDAGIDANEVKGIGITGQMHSSVFLDKKGQVIRPPILWCDGRTTAQCQQIESDVGGKAQLIELTGNPALEGFTAPKILWLRDNEKAHYDRIRTVMLPKDYIRYRLTGEIVTDVSDAAGTLLMDVTQRSWSTEVLASLGFDETWLPPIAESAHVVGAVHRETAALTGLAPGTPVVAGGADNTCGAIGAGVVKPGQALVSIGSSGVVFAPSAAPVRHPEGIVHTFAHSVPNVWYVMGVTLAAGMSLRWVRDELGHAEQAAARLLADDAYDMLAEQASRAPIGAEGLYFLPYLNGERTPHVDADARGVWFGLSTTHRRAHFLRSVFEGITFSLRDSLAAIHETGVQVKEARVIGGGAKSAFWHQLLTDVLGIPIARLQVDEGPGFGAALLAGVGTGVYANIEEATAKTVAVQHTREPDPDAKQQYDHRFQFFQSLYPVLQPAFESLAQQPR